MKLLRLKNNHDNSDILINFDLVGAVTPVKSELGAHVYIVGDDQPVHVRDSLEDIFTLASLLSAVSK